MFDEESLEIKSQKSIEDNISSSIKSNDNIDIDININRKWLKLVSFSCRYDTFMFLYTFVMKPILDKVIFENNETYEIINFYNILSLDILKLNNKELNEGIWNILNHYKENYPFIKAGYKQYYSITQLFSNFEKNPIFLF